MDGESDSASRPRLESRPFIAVVLATRDFGSDSERIFSTETSSSMSYPLKAPNDAYVPTSACYDPDQDAVPNTFILSAHSSVPQDSKCRHPAVNPPVHKPSFAIAFLLGPIIANIPTSHASSFRTLDMAQLRLSTGPP